jgi:hypothetical protein
MNKNIIMDLTSQSESPTNLKFQNVSERNLRFSTEDKDEIKEK